MYLIPYRIIYLIGCRKVVHLILLFHPLTSKVSDLFQVVLPCSHHVLYNCNPPHRISLSSDDISLQIFMDHYCLHGNCDKTLLWGVPLHFYLQLPVLIFFLNTNGTVMKRALGISSTFDSAFAFQISEKLEKLPGLHPCHMSALLVLSLC